MTREEAKKAAEVMQHFANGGEVEWRYRNHVLWYPFKEGKPWNFESYDYRIAKPEPVSIPITEEEKKQIIGVWTRGKKDGTLGYMHLIHIKNKKDDDYFLNPKTQCWEEWSEELEKELMK